MRHQYQEFFVRLLNFPRLAAFLFVGAGLVSGRAQAFSSSSPADAPAAVVAFGNPSTPAQPADSAQTSASTNAASRAFGQAAPAEGHTSVDRPFRSLAVEAKIGINGIGFDFASPLNRFLHLRAGAQFFDHTVSITTDGIQASGDITLQNVQASVDIFPFRRSSFHLSPGVTLHNDNHIAGPINIPAGQSFSLGDTDYTSDPANPVTGFSRLRFGSTFAPRITAGFGNMLPRNGSHFSVPIEIGIQYTSAPVVELALQGNACSSDGCGPINSGDGASNLQSEVQMLESDLKPLRFFPIASIGISYKFSR